MGIVKNKGGLEKEFLYWLTRCPGLGAVSVRKAGAYAGSFRNVYYIEGTELWRAGILRGEKQCRSFDGWKKELEPMCQEYHGLGKRGIRFITPLESEYPERLRHIYDYPMGLYVKGGLPEEGMPTAAVIGARTCTAYGRQCAEYMGSELSGNGVQVISGLALGIDGAGHEGAIRGGGKTFAIMGCGVNICYPRTNYKVFEQILAAGGIISEYGPDEEPCARNFPVRNRIISGLSDVILVIEARQKSGSLITANLGLEQGKEIFALPGRITDPLSEGCNGLIREGAGILTSPGDVLEYMGILYEKQMISYKKNHKGLAKNEKMVYSCLDSEPRYPEQIAVQTGLAIGQCISSLLELELGGLAVRAEGQYYIRPMAD